MVFMGLGDEIAALRVAETGVRFYAPGGCSVTLAAKTASTVLAWVQAHFGHADEAVDILEKVLPAPSWLSTSLLEADPKWDPLRSQALLAEYVDEVEHRSTVLAPFFTASHCFLGG